MISENPLSPWGPLKKLTFSSFRGPNLGCIYTDQCKWNTRSNTFQIGIALHGFKRILLGFKLGRAWSLLKPASWAWSRLIRVCDQARTTISEYIFSWRSMRIELRNFRIRGRSFERHFCDFFHEISTDFHKQCQQQKIKKILSLLCY